MSTDTTNFGFTRPSVGDSGPGWATQLNSCIQEIDTLLAVFHDTDGTPKADAVDVTAAIKDGIVTAAKIADRTRTFLVQATDAYVTGTGAAERSGPTGHPMANSAETRCYGNFYLPSDYVSGLSIKGVVYPAATGNASILHSTYHGAVGEAYSAHSDVYAESSEPIAVTANQIAAIAEVTPTNVSAGDYFFLDFLRAGEEVEDTVSGTVYFVGWLISYTADS